MKNEIYKERFVIERLGANHFLVRENLGKPFEYKMSLGSVKRWIDSCILRGHLAP